MMMARPSSHNQYRSKKPASATFSTGGGTVNGELGSGGNTGGAGCSTTGAGAMTGGCATAFGAACLAVIFLGFRVAGMGAGSLLAAGCSAMATATGAVSGVASGTDGFSGTAAACAGSTTATGSGLDAQADKTSAEKSSVTGIATLSILGMAFSNNYCLAFWYQAEIIPQLVAIG
jgi:hypothetical protein